MAGLDESEAVANIFGGADDEGLAAQGGEAEEGGEVRTDTAPGPWRLPSQAEPAPERIHSRLSAAPLHAPVACVGFVQMGRHPF